MGQKYIGLQVSRSEILHYIKQHEHNGEKAKQNQALTMCVSCWPKCTILVVMFLIISRIQKQSCRFFKIIFITQISRPTPRMTLGGFRKLKTAKNNLCEGTNLSYQSKEICQNTLTRSLSESPHFRAHLKVHQVNKSGYMMFLRVALHQGRATSIYLMALFN